MEASAWCCEVSVTAEAELRARAARSGPLPRSAFGPGPAVDLPAGMGTAVAAELDRLWGELRCPDPFVVVEDAGGDGSRAAAVLGSDPGCAAALRYLVVEADPALRARHGSFLALESPTSFLGPVPDEPDEPDYELGLGPLAASLGELPRGLTVAVVVAVGWLSRLRLDHAWEADGGWWETRLAPRAPLAPLAAAESGGGVGSGVGGWAEVVVPVPGPSSADPGSDWLAAACRVAERGWVMAIDEFSAGARGAALRRVLDRHPPPIRHTLSPFPRLQVFQWPIAGR